jgi:3-oxoadipate enol-lactonase
MHATNEMCESFYEKMSVISVPTILGDISVRVGGDGPPMMFWSSLLMNGKMWLAQVERFGWRHKVILVDPPGHGDSSALTRLFTFEECAMCVVQILDAIDCRKVHFVGNSWGGMIGATFAARFPERIHSAVLMNCTASPAGIKHKIVFPLLALGVRLAGGVRGPLMPLVLDAFVGPTTKASLPGVIAVIVNSLRACNVASTIWAVKSVVPNRPDQRMILKHINVPVLVLAGEEDKTFSVDETREMANCIPGAKFLVLSKTAHLAALENPVEVNQAIDLHVRDFF